MAKAKNIKYTSFFNARLTSTISISLVLFILGVIALLSVLATNLTSLVKENMGFSIVLNESANDSQIKRLQKKLDKSPYSRAVQFISKEEALKELEAELGENPEDFLGFNPLQASIEVKLKADYAHADSLQWIEKELKAGYGKNIQEITYEKDLIQSINDNVKRIGLALLALALVLMIISFALISNTIRLSAYSKRFIIHTMKLVGATPGFIRKPFIISNIVNGIIASVIAIGLLTACVYYMMSGVENFYTLLSVESLLQVYAVILLLGVLLTSVSAYFAVNRYIRMDRDNLYYI